MRVTGIIDLDLQTSYLCKSVIFAIVNDIAIPLIVGTAYEKKFIGSIQRISRRLTASKNGIAAILDVFDSPVCTIESKEDVQRRKVHLF